jgi:hypothetical protein
MASTGVTVFTLVLVGFLTGTAAAHKQSAKPGAKVTHAARLASQSISEVVTLHDLALTVKPGSGAPRALSSFAQLATTFATEAQACTAIGPPAASLGRTLSVYHHLASEIAASAGKTSATLPSAFTVTIKANDKKWKSALTAIGRADHSNLLKTVPKLLYATGTGK